MKFWAGVTDIQWFQHLRRQSPPVAEVNYWVPGGTPPFKHLDEGTPFLFKLKAPINKIAGVGFYFGFRRLPLRLAWETFKLENGRDTYEELATSIAKYRHQTSIRGTEEIGCIVLEQPVFFPEDAWTRPVLEAAHIQPVTMSGTNEVQNGLLLRSDMHILYDDGLIGVTPDYEIRISERIREQYVNGKVYYAWDGKKLSTLPSNPECFPSRDRLEWHMSNIFEA